MALPALVQRSWLGALGACALCACSASDGSAAYGTSSAPRVVLGTGEAVFEPMEGEPHLPLVAGIQGGFHAWASLLAYDFSGDRLDMVLETRVADDPASSLVMRARLPLREALDTEGQPALSFAGFPAQVADARCAHGKRVRVHVTLSDPAGGSAEDTRHYIAELASNQQRDSCE